MQQVTRSYVEFRFPGIFFSEFRAEEVTSRDPESVKVPKSAFAFQFFDVLEVTTGDGLVLRSERLNLSKLYYVGGCILTLEDVKREYPEHPNLIHNMETGVWDRLIKTRLGNVQPFGKDDVQLSDR